MLMLLARAGRDRKPSGHDPVTIGLQAKRIDPAREKSQARPMRTHVLHLTGCCLWLVAATGMAAAQNQGRTPNNAPLFAPRQLTTPIPEFDSGVLRLTATFGQDARGVINSGLVWRVFQERAEPDGSHRLVAQSTDASPSFTLPNADYIVHAAYGLAGTTRRVSINGQDLNERIALNAGALVINGMLGDLPVPPNRLSISVFVPDRGNAEAKLIASDVKAGEALRLPEGTYHVVSTFLEAAAAGGAAGNPTNSIVDADARVQAGKVTETTLRHRAAVLTLKLVNQPGGEALANTNFTVLTPGGDVIREMIGAFPSLPLAEGEYVVIARRDGKTHQAIFTVQSARDRDVEVLAK